MDKEERQMSSSYSVRGIEKLINNFIFLTTVLYTSKEFVRGAHCDSYVQREVLPYVDIFNKNLLNSLY